MVAIPRPITFIDDIVLDVELQLIREETEEDWLPVKRAWDAYIPRATWDQPLPCQEWQPKPEWHLNFHQAEFIRELVYRGEIGRLGAIGLAHNANRWQTAYEMVYGKPLNGSPHTPFLNPNNRIIQGG